MSQINVFSFTVKNKQNDSSYHGVSLIKANKSAQVDGRDIYVDFVNLETGWSNMLKLSTFVKKYPDAMLGGKSFLDYAIKLELIDDFKPTKKQKIRV